MTGVLNDTTNKIGLKFETKFVAFIDIMGFKSMIEDAEAGRARSTLEIRAILSELDRQKDIEFFKAYGPQICPESAFLSSDLSFEITQVADCVVVSSEVSPAGAINIINTCWSINLNLMMRGVLVRGYVTLGSIHHRGKDFYGTGYQSAVDREKAVSAFKIEADEKGTPFIEIDPAVCEYIANSTDQCVRMMFSRLTKSDGQGAAIFPFQRLSHSIAITPEFDVEKEKTGVSNLRKWLADFRKALLLHVDSDNEKAMKKVRHYLAALDRQEELCDETELVLNRIARQIRQQT